MPSMKIIIILLLFSIACTQKTFAIMSMQSGYLNLTAPGAYAVDSTQDQELVIDDKIYYPKTFCHGIRVGDYMSFVDGEPNDCVSAKLFNLRTRLTCDVWCD